MQTEPDSSKIQNDDTTIVSADGLDPASSDEKQDVQKDKNEGTPNPNAEDKTKAEENKEPESDPIDDLFEAEKPDPANLTGDKHFQIAADKKFDELRGGLETGDKESISAFQSLKPKLQEAVAKRFRIDGDEVGSAKDLMEFLSAEHGAIEKEGEDKDKSTPISQKDAEFIKAKLTNQFRAQAEKSGIKFEDLKKDGTYKAVVEGAKNSIALMQKNGIASDQFDSFFDFEKEWLAATTRLQTEKSYKEGMEAQKKVNTAHNSNPANGTAMKNGTEILPLMNTEDFMKLPQEKQVQYQEMHQGVFLD